MRSCDVLRRVRFGVFALAVGVLLSTSLSAANPLSREELVRRHGLAVAEAEKAGLSSHDPFNILPKLREARALLDRGDLNYGQVLLEQAAQDLELWGSLSRASGEAQKLRWLETYWDILQKFAFLALIAFLFVRRSSWRKALRQRKFSVSSRTVLALWTGLLAALFWGLDSYRYGSSVFAFFDIRIVLLVIGGLIGGWLISLPAVFILSALAMWAGDRSLAPLGLMALAAVGSGAMSLGIRHYDRPVRVALGCGLFFGLVHGAVVYAPSLQVLPPLFAVLSILLLAGLEAAGVVLFFAVVGAVLREDIRRDTENELLRTRLLFLQAQLRPHFFFNALNTIAAVCARENAGGARGLILKLADFLRHTLKREHETATLREEISFIEDYLEIEKARFQDQLEVIKDYRIAEAAWQSKVPLLILQPLVENSVRHGLRKKTSGGWVRIRLEEGDGVLKVEIEDNGVGAEPMFFEKMLRGEKTEVQGLGIGVRNIHERLKRHFGNKASLSFKTAIGEGTRATVVLPLTPVKAGL